MPATTFDAMLPGTASPEGGLPPVLLFGGTFDPPHRAHRELAFAARDTLFPKADAWLVFVPAAISPHKAASPTPGRHRVEMLRLACRGRSRWWVWTEELNRAERVDVVRADSPSYWVDTLELAAKQHHELWFLIGADQALAFNRWHQWERILELARPVVIARDSISDSDVLRDSMLAQNWSEPDAGRFLARARVLGTPVLDVNATAIRAALASEAPALIAGLDPEVERYARRLGLYHP